ncbi:MAG: GGDEF domain-containing protein [Betaproteobacteria bacterium]
MLPLLPDLEAISGCRDRRLLGHLIVATAGKLLGEQSDVALFRKEPDDINLTLSHGPTVMAAALGPWVQLLETTIFPDGIATSAVDGRTYGVLPLQSSEVSSSKTLLAFAVDTQVATDNLDNLLCIARLYGNHVKLLDYSELDSLTRLLNRKTFDETFDRLLLASGADSLDEDQEDRRDAEDGEPWLGVIDIDHFKRINDNFGHLFGDEVLLRVAELMRKTFRTGDRLFRFGGEEFIVILNANGNDLAAKGFDRFREAVEAYEFPQVGKVTCSVGITGVSNTDVPTDVVGRADEALYFAKEHGRNQVHCYEALIAQGAIEKAAAPEAPVNDDFDIDALFD